MVSDTNITKLILIKVSIGSLLLTADVGLPAGKDTVRDASAADAILLQTNMAKISIRMSFRIAGTKARGL